MNILGFLEMAPMAEALPKTNVAQSGTQSGCVLLLSAEPAPGSRSVASPAESLFAAALATVEKEDDARPEQSVPDTRPRGSPAPSPLPTPKELPDVEPPVRLPPRGAGVAVRTALSPLPTKQKPASAVSVGAHACQAPPPATLEQPSLPDFSSLTLSAQPLPDRDAPPVGSAEEPPLPTPPVLDAARALPSPSSASTEGATSSFQAPAPPSSVNVFERAPEAAAESVPSRSGDDAASHPTAAFAPKSPDARAPEPLPLRPHAPVAPPPEKPLPAPPTDLAPSTRTADEARSTSDTATTHPQRESRGEAPPARQASTTDAGDTTSKRRAAASATTTSITGGEDSTQSASPSPAPLLVPGVVRTETDVAVTRPTVSTVDTLTHDKETPAPPAGALTGLMARSGGATARIDLPDLGRVAITATGHPSAVNVTITPAKEAAVVPLLAENAAITSDLRSSSTSLAQARVDIGAGGAENPEGRRPARPETGEPTATSANARAERTAARRVRIVL